MIDLKELCKDQFIDDSIGRLGTLILTRTKEEFDIIIQELYNAGASNIYDNKDEVNLDFDLETNSIIFLRKDYNSDEKFLINTEENKDHYNKVWNGFSFIEARDIIESMFSIKKVLTNIEIIEKRL